MHRRLPADLPVAVMLLPVAAEVSPVEVSLAEVLPGEGDLPVRLRHRREAEGVLPDLPADLPAV